MIDDTKVSVIMPSFLGKYDGCASDRENKFVRAVNSFLENNYQNKELIVVGDACEKTKELLNEYFSVELKIGTIVFYNFSKKQKLFSGKLRTKGIELASGEIIMYLDTDDMYGSFHIKAVADQMYFEGLEWCYFDDFINSDRGLVTKSVDLEHESIGTSSIAHLKTMVTNSKTITWKRCNGYGHDWKFIKKLMKTSKNYDKIYGACYIICHIPHKLDR